VVRLRLKFLCLELKAKDNCNQTVYDDVIIFKTTNYIQARSMNYYSQRKQTKTILFSIIKLKRSIKLIIHAHDTKHDTEIEAVYP